MIHGIAGELGVLKAFLHGEVWGRLLFPFLDQLADTTHPQQRALMAELHAQLFSEPTDSPTIFLKQWLKQRAISPFWHRGPILTGAEVEWVLARANSKNLLVNYSREQMHAMLAQAWTLAD